MATLTPIQQRNRDLADKMNEEALRNPQSPNAGKFVGIANGKLVVVADNWDDVARQLRQAEPDPANCFCIELGRDYSEVCYFPFALEECERPTWVKDALAAAHVKRKRNEEVANQLTEEAKRDPALWPLGKYVGIASGKVIVVSDDLDEIMRQLDAAEPDPINTFFFEPGRDYTEPVEIWQVNA